MKAAFVSSFDLPPRVAEVPEPNASGPGELVVEVLAAGLHPRVRSQADGSHYTSTGDLPLVPGIDGVGRGPDGRLYFFVLPDTRHGSMAEKTVIDLRRAVPLPGDVDPVAIAALMNPAMSSWIALRRRITFQPGQKVLILGATGNAGRVAVQVAKHFGAAQIVAVGRDEVRLSKLSTLGATASVALGQSAAALGAAAEVDVVLDYLWGEPGAAAMAAIITARPDRQRPLTWIQIGSVAGATAPIPSAALRAARLQIVGSGQGSVPTADIVGELPALAAEVARGTLEVDARPVPLADVERAWTDSAHSTQRVVIVPRS